MLVRLQRWVPPNQPLLEHWSMSTSCRFTSTRTTPLSERRKRGKSQDKSAEEKREVEILRGVNKRNKWNWRIKCVQQEWKKSETEQEGRWKQAERRHVDYTDAGEVRMKGKKIKNRKEEQCLGEVRLKVQQAGEGRCSRTGGIGINWKGEELRVMEVSNEKEERDRGKEKEAGSDS